MSKNSELINQMTLEEKASLMSGHDFWGSREVGRLNIPQMFMADGPHGLRKQGGDGDHLGLVEGIKATCFPTSATVANSWNLGLCEEVGQALGKEAAFNEVNVLLGPGLNTKRNPLCGRNFEYFSEDPYLSGKLAAAYIKGIQLEGVSACPKHFAANNQEYLRMTNDSIVDERTLHELYLTGFEIAVKEGQPKAIMSAYNKINGIYANEHPYLLKEVLVDNWGFDGMVISDWGGANDPVEGVKAGAHLEMPTPGYDSVQRIIDAVKDGTLEEEVLDQRVSEYLKVLEATSLEEKIHIDYEAHDQLAQKMAEQSAVLLKNDHVLPLKKGTKALIIGDYAKTPRYQGAGSSMVNPYKLESTMDVIGETSLEVVGFAQGYERSGKPNKMLMNDAVSKVKQAEVAIIYVGLNEVDEVEGHDRKHMKIGGNQVEVIEAVAQTAKKIVVVISGGSVIEMPWASKCDGIIHGYLGGQAGARAMVNVIMGKVNPSGKLSETYPVKYEDCPSAAYYPGKEATSEYREGIYVGYRYYDKAEKVVRYPFGYGLSYTSFKYEDLNVTDTSVSCKVTNTGDVAGSEIVQLYVGRDQDAIHRPEKELKGFIKVELQPGVTKEVVIDFDAFTFRYYDAQTHNFIIQEGLYQIMIGSSSRDIHLQGILQMQGTTVVENANGLLDKYLSGDVADVTSKEFEALYGKSLPESHWDRKKPLGINDTLLQMCYAKNPLARLVIKILVGLRDRSYKKGQPDLNLFFLSNMPFRAIAKMSNGAVSLEMSEHMVTIVNGHFFKGLGRLIKAFFNYRKRGINK